MAENTDLTEEQQEELYANMYKLKYSQNEIEVIEASKYIMSNTMDLDGIRRILRVMATDIVKAKDNAADQDMAVDVAQKSFNNILAQLFVNSFRMGMLEQQQEYRKLLQQVKAKSEEEIIGEPAKDNDTEK